MQSGVDEMAPSHSLVTSNLSIGLLHVCRAEAHIHNKTVPLEAQIHMKKNYGLTRSLLRVLSKLKGKCIIELKTIKSKTCIIQ